MREIFSVVLTTSWRACPALLVVLAARGLLRRAPAGFWRVLWWGAFFRLACPFALFIPIPVAKEAMPMPLEILGAGAGPLVPQNPDPVLLPGTGIEVAPALPSADPGMLLAAAWGLGCLLLLAWGLLSFLGFSRCLTGAVRLEGNVWQGDCIPGPVTVGLFRPRIYLPSALEGEERDYVLLHEQAHIRWGDPVFKVLAYLILALHWFNPLAWAAFLWACRDMEAASDEGALGRMGQENRQGYAAALLHVATGRRVLAGGPPAFGEGDLKGRIRRVMAYKKPAPWAAAAAGAVALGVTVSSLLGLVPQVYAAEKPLAFVPYDSFFFVLMPGEAQDYRQAITLAETADLYYQVTWTPTGLNTEVGLGAESGARVGSAPSYLVDGRGGVAAGVFEEVPPGEYRLIVRSAAENQAYSNTTLREDLEIAGAAAFGWREGDGWKTAAGADPQEGTITFPAYQEGREDYNAVVYDIQPFQLSIRLPEGWSVRVPPPEERGTSFAFTPLWLYQGEEYAGSIAYNTFEIYPDVPPENFYRMVYNQLMLGSVLNWDNEYTVVRDWGSGCSATVQIMESQGAAGPADMRPGILAYDRDRLVYVAIQLENGRLSSQEVWELAESLQIL